jgi:hypothetical protein
VLFRDKGTLFPARLFTPMPKAAKRIFEFSTTQINNDHTRKAYLNAALRFAQWCEARGRRRHQDQDRQSHFPRDWHDRLA